MSSSHKNSKAYGTQKSQLDRNKSGPTEMEFQEWNMELRGNNVCMDEHNCDVRLEKIKDLENCEAQRRQDRETFTQERNRVSEERDRTRERANEEKETTYTAREEENDQRENVNRLRELENVKREGSNKTRELANDKREWLVY
jgi:dTDP-4-amino-4,6-dideoxygalactose transaminase